MANPNQVQAIHEAGQFLQANEEARENFEHQAHLATFQNGIMAYVGLWKSNPTNDLTCIQLFGEWHLYNNLRVAMLKEVVGLGP